MCASNDTTPAHCDGNVANLGYDWDTVGNVIDRTDTHMQGWQQETFCYDNLNRLTNAAFGTGCTGGGNSVNYDAIGNIVSKGHVGSYTYNPSQPHAVAGIDTTWGNGKPVNGVASPTFQYDANGNMTSGAGRTVSYTSFNMAASVTSGGNSLSFTYTPEHQRMVMVCVTNCPNSNNYTRYFNDSITGAMAEYYKLGSAIYWRTMIVADGKLVAERIVQGTNISMRYFVLDHLGSVAVITDENGLVLKDGQGNETGRLSYDAWGRMRNLDGSLDPTCAQPQNEATNSGGVTRGFTGQEEMAPVCLRSESPDLDQRQMKSGQIARYGSLCRPESLASGKPRQGVHCGLCALLRSVDSVPNMIKARWIGLS